MIWLFTNLIQFTVIPHEFGHLLMATALNCDIYSTKLVQPHFYYFFILIEGKFLSKCSNPTSDALVALGGLLITLFIIIILFSLPYPFHYFGLMALGLELAGIFQDTLIFVESFYPSVLIARTIASSVTFIGLFLYFLGALLFVMKYE